MNVPPFALLTDVAISVIDVPPHLVVLIECMAHDRPP